MKEKSYSHLETHSVAHSGDSESGNLSTAGRAKNPSKNTINNCSPRLRSFPSITFITANMISDGDLYRLAIFFGTTAMILIVLYHFLEVNAAKDPIEAGKEGASKSL
ncbi:hypothetical protein Forpe1208_v010452 [Fusarium oxysporum f. sp. rapae]|uniref:Oligosaccaryltransferase n=1 Tax=Fusarium oxysporum f. sp. rapae TaxID=485398 RepID=A0A8J5NYQ2_FUSOX|nr:hypothetical protein Forpe1208_v010452 [Fusarium oxysporum f. sp. rapae]